MCHWILNVKQRLWNFRKFESIYPKQLHNKIILVLFSEFDNIGDQYIIKINFYKIGQINELEERTLLIWQICIYLLGAFCQICNFTAKSKNGPKWPKINNNTKFLLPGVFCHICNYIAERVVYGGHQGHIHLKDFVFLLVWVGQLFHPHPIHSSHALDRESTQLSWLDSCLTKKEKKMLSLQL